MTIAMLLKNTPSLMLLARAAASVANFGCLLLLAAAVFLFLARLCKLG